MDNKAILESLKSIDDSLKLLVRLTLQNQLKDFQIKDQIKALYQMHLQPSVIADVLNKSPNAVTGAISKMKKAGELK